MVRVYISHSIRGIKGADATREDMEANNRKAIEFSLQLKDKFPEIDFYCPGEHDEFVLGAYEKNMLAEQQILEVDCWIIDRRNAVLAWIPDQYISTGMLVESVYALRTGKHFMVAKDQDQAEIVIERLLEDLKR